MRMRDTFLKPMHPEGRKFVAIFAVVSHSGIVTAHVTSTSLTFFFFFFFGWRVIGKHRKT